MKLSTSIEDAITGGTDSRGRDAQLTEWAGEARKLEAHKDALVDQCVRYAKRIEELRAALERIAAGEGTFSRDNYQFACNVIEESKTIAREALCGADQPVKSPITREWLARQPDDTAIGAGTEDSRCADWCVLKPGHPGDCHVEQQGERHDKG